MVDDERDLPRMPIGTPPVRPHALDPTVPGGTATPSQDTFVPTPRPTPIPINLPLPGYQLGELIGRGGMGEVVAAHDQRIGREVAIKRMRNATPDEQQLSRFLREARIQARLDHPAIVPVHELGTDESGRPYFTMKRISGKTLAERMTDGASLQALLRAFVDVCLAMDLAHSRAVIHRDLKPANIMLGDYGEVYVLDWGVARVLTDQPDTSHEITTLEEGTQTGSMLGTPGYMSPEQIQSTPATSAADVYALGAILFEILAGEPLHPRGMPAVASTLTTPQDSPAKRRSERTIAPELDAICFACLAKEPEARPSARVLADRVQAYLDGDRDVERRGKLAQQHLKRAHAGLRQGGAEGRASAMREAGLALALAPTSIEAAALLTTLLVEPPDPIPPELEAALKADERKVTRQRARVGAFGYAMLYAFVPLLPWLGVKNWSWLIAIYVVATALSAAAWLGAKRGTYNLAFGLIGNLTLAILFTRIAGVFLITPVIVCGMLVGLTTTRWFASRRWMIIGFVAATVLTPIGIEALGWMPHTWEVTRTAIISHSTIFEIEGLVADLAMIGGTIAFVSLFGLVAAKIHGAAKDAKRKLSIQAWHLKQLVPQAPITRF